MSCLEKSDTHDVTKHESDSPKVDVGCAVIKKKVIGPLIFEEPTVTTRFWL